MRVTAPWPNPWDPASGEVVVTVPVENADALREAIGGAGGGRLGAYSFCSFSIPGVGRFRPEAGARPHIGAVGRLEAVDEERIEVTCEAEVMDAVIAAIRRTHPYEEIALDVFQLIEWPKAR